MFSVLANSTYRHLFIAQILALLGTGLATVALGLLAFDLANEHAGIVLGTVFTIKMVAYVGIAPIAGAFASRFPRRKMLICLDLIRAGIALTLPFVTEVWQIYILIFLLQSASAAFTPAFQATIPDILPEEEHYTRALSLSRLAYDLENLISPILAATLLVVFSYHALFAGTVLGFIGSAFLVMSTTLPNPKVTVARGFFDLTTRGVRIYLATPRLRGLLALTFAASAAGAMVLVNTVVLVRAELELGDTHVAITLGAFGGGSMMAALFLPRVLDSYSDRKVMMGGASVLITALTGMAMTVLFYELNFIVLLMFWGLIGVGYSVVLTPSGRLLRRSAHEEDRPALYGAQFALSHCCWLITYPLTGWLMVVWGPTNALYILAVLAGIALVCGVFFWSEENPQGIEHRHDDLPADHPHLQGAEIHRHPFIIDDYHPSWPRIE